MQSNLGCFLGAIAAGVLLAVLIAIVAIGTWVIVLDQIKDGAPRWKGMIAVVLATVGLLMVLLVALCLLVVWPDLMDHYPSELLLLTNFDILLLGSASSTAALVILVWSDFFTGFFAKRFHRKTSTLGTRYRVVRPLVLILLVFQASLTIYGAVQSLCSHIYWWQHFAK